MGQVYKDMTGEDAPHLIPAEEEAAAAQGDDEMCASKATPCVLGLQYPILQAAKNRDGLHMRKHLCGRARKGYDHINVHFLKPCRLHPDGRTRQALEEVLCLDEDAGGSQLASNNVYLQYKYRNFFTQHLPHKLAVFIGDHYEEDLQIEKEGDQWTVDELNEILHNNLVRDTNGCQIHTHLKIQWEHEACEGTPEALCSPFKKWHGRKTKVFFLHVSLCNTFIVPISCRYDDTSGRCRPDS